MSEGADKQSVGNGANVETRMVDGWDMVVSERVWRLRHPFKRSTRPHSPWSSFQKSETKHFPPRNIPLVRVHLCLRTLRRDRRHTQATLLGQVFKICLDTIRYTPPNQSHRPWHLVEGAGCAELEGWLHVSGAPLESQTRTPFPKVRTRLRRGSR